MNAFLNQISNRNFLVPSGYKFSLSRNPKVDFFSTSVNIPGINLGVAVQSNYFKDIPVPGDKISFDDFTLNFIVDENLENYLEIQNWIRGFGFPEYPGQYAELLENDILSENKQNAYSGQSDGTLLIYNSNFVPNIKVNFRGLFPVSLSEINFDSSDTQVAYITSQVTLKYTMYNISKI
jgi:hypothetical protein